MTGGKSDANGKGLRGASLALVIVAAVVAGMAAGAALSLWLGDDGDDDDGSTLEQRFPNDTGVLKILLGLYELQEEFKRANSRYAGTVDELLRGTNGQDPIEFYREVCFGRLEPLEVDGKANMGYRIVLRAKDTPSTVLAMDTTAQGARSILDTIHSVDSGITCYYPGK
jgi:hypothetical protein